jgi:small-conductance mechanosensitive channel
MLSPSFRDEKLEKVVDILFQILDQNEEHFKFMNYYLLFCYLFHLRECARCREKANVSEELLEQFYRAYKDAGIEIEFGTISHPPEDESHAQ